MPRYRDRGRCGARGRQQNSLALEKPPRIHVPVRGCGDAGHRAGWMGVNPGVAVGRSGHATRRDPCDTSRLERNVNANMYFSQQLPPYPYPLPRSSGCERIATDRLVDVDRNLWVESGALGSVSPLQPEPEGSRDCLIAIGGAELTKQIGAVELHRVHRDVQILGDAGVAATPTNMSQDPRPTLRPLHRHPARRSSDEGPRAPLPLRRRTASPRWPPPAGPRPASATKAWPGLHRQEATLPARHLPAHCHGRSPRP